MKTIDLNTDAGEIPELISNGNQDRLFHFVTSVNVACGGHAGDESTMDATLRSAQKRGLTIGAHPSYPDRENFGRLRNQFKKDEIIQTVFEQLKRLNTVCVSLNAKLFHVKPHGALYNDAAFDLEVASALAKGISKFSKSLFVVGPASSPMLELFRALNFSTVAEAFVDRTYDSQGKLVSRGLPGAVITDPLQAAHQALEIVRDGVVRDLNKCSIPLSAETLCIHSDTPDASNIASAVVNEFKRNKIEIVSFERSN